MNKFFLHLAKNVWKALLPLSTSKWFSFYRFSSSMYENEKIKIWLWQRFTLYGLRLIILVEFYYIFYVTWKIFHDKSSVIIVVFFLVNFKTKCLLVLWNFCWGSHSPLMIRTLFFWRLSFWVCLIQPQWVINHTFKMWFNRGFSYTLYNTIIARKVFAFSSILPSVP